MSSRRLRSKKDLTKPAISSISAPSNRPRRAAAQASAAATSSALDRETDSPDEPRQEKAIRLKVGSRLREVEKPSITVGGRRGGGASARDSFEGGEIVVGGRPRKKAIVEESSEEEEEEDEDAEGEEEDVDAEEDEDEDAEGDEDADGDEDVEMDDAPPATATVKVGGATGMRTKPSVTITPAQDDKLPSVEDQEMAMDDDDDEELSELESQEDEEGGEDDAEGEEDEEMDAEGDEEEDAEGDSDEDDETPASMSRSHTPDPTKLTRRQRGEFEGGLMALSNEAQKKKHLTAEEHAARRAEMARRRKNLSEKRNEEEKMDTINRLLKKQAPKRRGRREMVADGEDEGMESEEMKPPSIYTRLVSNAEGIKVAVPDEYLAANNISGVFQGGVTGGKPAPFRGRLIEEIEAN